MAIGVLVLGKPGTGKSYSMKSFSPDEVKILSVHKPILPFRGKYEIVKTPTGRDIIKEMKNTKKKNIVVDDFQYVLGLPMMHRVSEKGWDKFNEIQQPYADVLEAVSDLPDDVIVYFTSHTDTDNDGNTKIKTIGNALDKYIAVEGLFMIVLGTVVVNDNYYFATQNSGNDTLKSPDGMFPSKWIPNDLKYVEDKIRNYYYMDGAKTDEEIAVVDAEHTVADSDVKPERKARGRGKTTTEITTPPTTEPEQEQTTSTSRRARSNKTHDEVVVENNQKIADYMEQCDAAIVEAAGDTEEVDFDTACAATENIPKPELETPPRRTRKERKSVEQSEPVQDGTINTDSESVTLDADTYFYVPADDNYVMKHKGDTVDLIVDGVEVMKVISKEEFGEGVKRLAQADNPKPENPIDGAMNPPEKGRRTRKRASQSDEETVEKPKRTRGRAKAEEQMKQELEKIDKIAETEGTEAVDFDRIGEDSTDTKEEQQTVTAETAWFRTADNNYIVKHKGDIIESDWVEVTQEEFTKGATEIATTRRGRTRKVRA